METGSTIMGSSGGLAHTNEDSVDGSIELDGLALPPFTLVVLAAGDEPMISAGAPSRAVLIGGEPLGHRHMWWNFVSSRKERIVQAADDWAAGRFAEVHTLEREPALHAANQVAHSALPGVRAHLGDSRAVLPGIVASLGGKRAVYWLDGHWSGAGTAGEDDPCPLLDELACLGTRPQDIVLIDDARLFLGAPPLPHDPARWPGIGQVLAALPGAAGAGASKAPPLVQVVDDVIFSMPDEPALRSLLLAWAQMRAAELEDAFLARQGG